MERHPKKQASSLWTPYSGQFSINSAYLSILANNSPEIWIFHSPILSKKISKLNLNDRLRLFLWKMAGKEYSPYQS
jgi:hypothetical protein